MKISQKISQFLIKIFCKIVGTDEFGNQYFVNKSGKRFVIYAGDLCETTKIPMHWHVWIHYNSNKAPSEIMRYSWQKTHIPNLTGTKNSFTSINQNLSKKKHGFIAWNPNSDNF